MRTNTKKLKETIRVASVVLLSRFDLQCQIPWLKQAKYTIAINMYVLEIHKQCLKISLFQFGQLWQASKS